jgi:hypothetical protein
MSETMDVHQEVPERKENILRLASSILITKIISYI